MCIGVPCRITQLVGDGPMPMGMVEVLGKNRQICFAYVPQAKVGDYVLIQNGFAMNLLTAQEAEESFNAWKELGIEDNEIKNTEN